MTIVEFLEARLAEDEAAAREAITPDRPGTHWEWESTADDDDPESPRWLRTVEEFPTTSGVGDLPGFPLGYDCKAEPSPAMDHIARHDPARVLREIAAKRIILEIHHTSDSEVTYPKWDSEARIIGLTNPCVGCGTGICDYWTQDINNCPKLQALAAIYSDHPDYQKEWAL